MIYNIKKYYILESISVLVISMTCVVLLGWLLDIHIFKSLFTGYVAMKANTAVGFILAGFLLFILTIKKGVSLGYWLAVTLTILSLLTLLEYVFSLNIGIDQFIVLDTEAILNEKPFPGRISPLTAFCFVLYGLSFLGINNNLPSLNKVAQYFLQTIALFSFVSLLRILYDIPSVFVVYSWNSMSMHTSVIFILLSISTLFIQHDQGIIKVFLGNKIGNFMFRSIFLKTIITIMILSSIRFISQKNNMLPDEYGFVLYTTLFIIVIFSFLTTTANHLNIIDVYRNRAESKVVIANKNLEQTVTKRTKNLVNQNKQLEEFAYIISHNLRGPVSNINSLIDFYETEEESDSKDEIVEKMKTTVNNLNDTLDELLQVVIIKNDLKKEKEILKFDTVFHKITQSYQAKIDEIGAIVTSDFSGVQEIEYASVYLNSIMENLLSNAIKYSDKNRTPHIHFGTKSIEDKILLSVSDNGLGINLKQNGDCVFGFHKVFHEHPEAKGVGLFLTKAQIVSMGGNISVESEVNVGTTFNIVF